MVLRRHARLRRRQRRHLGFGMSPTVACRGSISTYVVVRWWSGESCSRGVRYTPIVSVWRINIQSISFVSWKIDSHLSCASFPNLNNSVNILWQALIFCASFSNLNNSVNILTFPT